jgi:hypothetical protein
MPAVGQDARLLSKDVLARWLLEDFPFRIQLAPVFPFHPISGHALRYANTKTLVAAGSIDPGAGIADQTAVPVDPNRVYSFGELATQFRITYGAQDIFSSSGNDQAAVQMALAIRRLLYRFWTSFEQGEATHSGDFDGLLRLVDPSRVIDLEGRPLTLEVLERAKELVRTNDGRGIVAYTSSVGKRAIHAAHWVRGVTPQYVELSFPSPTGGRKPQHVLQFDGAPIYVCDLNQRLRYDLAVPGSPGVPVAPEDNAAVAEPGLASHIWFFVMGENNLHGITPASLGESMFVARSTLLPDGSTVVYHITMPTGIALGSRACVAVVKNAGIPETRVGGR